MPCSLSTRLFTDDADTGAAASGNADSVNTVDLTAEDNGKEHKIPSLTNAAVAPTKPNSKDARDEPDESSAVEVPVIADTALELSEDEQTSGLIRTDEPFPGKKRRGRGRARASTEPTTVSACIEAISQTSNKRGMAEGLVYLVVHTAPKSYAWTRPACAAPGCTAWLREDRDEKKQFVCWADDDVANCCHSTNWLERIHMVGVDVEDVRNGKHHLITIKEEVAFKLWPWLTVKHINGVLKDARGWERLSGKIAGTKINARLHIAYQKQNKLSVTVFLPDEGATVSDSE